MHMYGRALLFWKIPEAEAGLPGKPNFIIFFYDATSQQQAKLHKSDRGGRLRTCPHHSQFKEQVLQFSRYGTPTCRLLSVSDPEPASISLHQTLL